MTEILEKMKKYEHENTMLQDIITEVEGKLHIGKTLLEQQKEVDKMINNTGENDEKKVRHYSSYNKYTDKGKDIS